MSVCFLLPSLNTIHPVSGYSTITRQIDLRSQSGVVMGRLSWDYIFSGLWYWEENEWQILFVLMFHLVFVSLFFLLIFLWCFFFFSFGSRSVLMFSPPPHSKYRKEVCHFCFETLKPRRISVTLFRKDESRHLSCFVRLPFLVRKLIRSQNKQFHNPL